MHRLYAKADGLSRKVIGAAIEVHRHKGPGLIESIYEQCLLRELELRSIPAATQKIVRVEYKGLVFDEPLRFDLLVDNCLLVELKAVELPFALGALTVAANGLPSLRTLLLVLACMGFARTAAMLFNRLVDWSLDQRNPRTASRHLLVSKTTAVVLLVLSSTGFFLAAAAINRLTFLLAPVALAIIFFYSVTKRFTSATHFFLGLALAIAPVGTWIAQTGRVDLAPLVLGAGVICWVEGFD